MTLAVTGRNTTIVKALLDMLPEDERVERPFGDLATLDVPGLVARAPTDADRYVLAAGVLHPKRLLDQGAGEVIESLAVNLISTVALCEHVLGRNARARICIVGSESGEKGSFDTTYFLAKAALHAYVRERHLAHQRQQLVAVAPGVIADGGMTSRRADVPPPGRRGRLVTATEVARLIRFLLYEDLGFISNVVVPMTAGRWARLT